MAAKIDPGSLQGSDRPQVQADLLRVLEGALNSSGDPATAAANLVTDLRQFFILSESETAADTALWNLWMVLLGMVMTVPSNIHGTLRSLPRSRDCTRRADR